ncbi:hypothetical protein C5167_030925 [Papaver somniferum]|nr:hypothetical protein C5167_030925 [Papaver somniferum]
MLAVTLLYPRYAADSSSTIQTRKIGSAFSPISKADGSKVLLEILSSIHEVVVEIIEPEKLRTRRA